MNWYTWASIPVVIVGLWLYTSSMTQSFPTLKGKRICLLIAHPDDEAMFFAPTVLALTKPELGNHVRILCLSSGDAGGLGDIRKKELIKSGLTLGLRSEDDITIIEDSNFPDSMTKVWDSNLLSNLLTTQLVLNNHSNSRSSRSRPTAPPSTTIDVLLTFDQHGVSGHTNHRALHYGAHAFLRQSTHQTLVPGIDLYTLTTTTSMVRKYLGLFDAPLTVFLAWMRDGRRSRPALGQQAGEVPPGTLVFVSDVGGYRRARRAMTEAHKSQMVWFRWGWIGLSRYMVVNDLRIEKTL